MILLTNPVEMFVLVTTKNKSWPEDKNFALGLNDKNNILTSEFMQDEVGWVDT